MKLLLIAALFIIGAIACAAPTPTPAPDVPATVTAQVQAHLDALPTATPLPTYTPYPTATPYPTPTEAPTATPYPTATPRPTHTPYPTATAVPTPTPTPTPLPTATPTLTPPPTATPTPTPVPTSIPGPTATPTLEPEHDEWVRSGSWYRDFVWERSISQELGEDAADGLYRRAVLDADPSSWARDVALSLGCIEGLPVAYLIPYSNEVPSSVNVYVVGIWDDGSSDWVDESYYLYQDPFITEDGAAIYVFNGVQVRQILGVLQEAQENRNPRMELNSGMYNVDDENEPGLWGKHDPAGLDNALSYLECFGG